VILIAKPAGLTHLLDELHAVPGYVPAEETTSQVTIYHTLYDQNNHAVGS